MGSEKNGSNEEMLSRFYLRIEGALNFNKQWTLKAKAQLAYDYKRNGVPNNKTKKIFCLTSKSYTWVQWITV